MELTTTTSDSRKILEKPYARRLVPDEDGGYVASIQEFPGCVADGDNADEALKNLEAAAESWLEVALSHGQTIREPVSFDGYSGKIALRAPRSLHRQVAELAALEGSSINQILVMAIANYVGGKEVLHTALRSTFEKINNVQIFQTSVLMPSIGSFEFVKHATTVEAPPMEFRGNLLQPVKLTSMFSLPEPTHG